MVVCSRLWSVFSHFNHIHSFDQLTNFASGHVCLRRGHDRSMEYRNACVGFHPCIGNRIFNGLQTPRLYTKQSIAFFYILPIGIIQAVTNQQVGLNVITELIIGYALPGKPIAMMMFKTWGYITMSQALLFTSDFKLGHYMKVPCVLNYAVFSASTDNIVLARAPCSGVKS